VWCRTPRAVWTVKRPDDPRIGGAQTFSKSFLIKGRDHFPFVI